MLPLLEASVPVHPRAGEVSPRASPSGGVGPAAPRWARELLARGSARPASRPGTRWQARSRSPALPGRVRSLSLAPRVPRPWRLQGCPSAPSSRARASRDAGRAFPPHSPADARGTSKRRAGARTARLMRKKPLENLSSPGSLECQRAGALAPGPLLDRRGQRAVSAGRVADWPPPRSRTRGAGGDGSCPREGAAHRSRARLAPPAGADTGRQGAREDRGARQSRPAGPERTRRVRALQCGRAGRSRFPRGTRSRGCPVAGPGRSLRFGSVLRAAAGLVPAPGPGPAPSAPHAAAPGVRPLGGRCEVRARRSPRDPGPVPGRSEAAAVPAAVSGGQGPQQGVRPGASACPAAGGDTQGHRWLSRFCRCDTCEPSGPPASSGSASPMRFFI